MTRRSWSPAWVLAVLCTAACGRSPTEPSGAPSFLTGTWQGTVTIEVNPGEAGGLPATTAATTWTFEVVPQTNMQTFRATVQSAHLWLPITTVASTALVPTNTPPTHIRPAITTSTWLRARWQLWNGGGDAIDADFTGVDCSARFTGRVVLTKQ